MFLRLYFKLTYSYNYMLLVNGKGNLSHKDHLIDDSNIGTLLFMYLPINTILWLINHKITCPF